MTTTLKEQRMISAHKLGMRDYHKGRDMLIPSYMQDQDERMSYRAGYLGAQRRKEAREDAFIENFITRYKDQESKQ